ncbi:MAG: inorganic phosphate transporter, partial [Chthoniobacterales bacterium]|nr:inorganic phosphate transporter [Chthoniobacterales bacterium]
IWINVYEKVIIPMIASPLLGLVVSALIMIVINKALKKLKKNFRHHLLTRLQIFSGALMAFSHGSNDAQKTMGIITLSLISAKLIPEQGNQIPWWVILLCAVTMGLGTLAGGKKIIVTASEKITKLENESGLSANLAAAFVNLLCSRLGIPISTTHVVVGSITGSGAISNKGIIDFSTWRHMILTWILTLPGSSGIALIIYLIFARFLLPRLH